MADLSLYFRDSHGGLDDFGLDDFGLDDYGSECGEICLTDFLDTVQDNLTLLERLEQYAFSENVSNRQMVAQGLLDVLQEFVDNENDVISVMKTAARMSEDAEPTVRAELVEQVPNIAMFLHERWPNFSAAFSKYLVPIVVRYLTDPLNQVRKTSQAALLVLLEEGLISKADTETKVCSVLLDLTEPSSDEDYKIEAVAIMCKLVTMLNKDTVEHLLLPRFCELCSDASLFQVRKACAANFGELCSIVGQDATEELLMSKFADLCSDSLWGIRKACAECFTIVSKSTSPEVRHTKLAPLFISLISDPSRCVRRAAFQSLGRFISTFASPSSTGFLFGGEGTLLEVPRCTSESDSPLNSLNCSEISRCHTEATITNTAPNQVGYATPSPEHLSMVDNVDIHCFDDIPAQTPSVKHEAHLNITSRNNIPMVLESNRNHNEIEQVDENYRPPLPEINGEPVMPISQMTEKIAEKEDKKDEGEEKEEECPTSKSSSGKATSDQLDKPTDASPIEPEASSQHQIQIDSQLAESESSEVQSQTVMSPTEEEVTVELPTLDSSPVQEQGERETQTETQEGQEEYPPDLTVLVRDDLDHSSVESELIESMEEEGKEDYLQSLAPKEKPKVQNVIPQQLLDQYLSMVDPAQAQTIDTEIAKHCAFSLPGVALTLGRENWHCLKDTFETLATDVQWTVRRTLAFSIHELAVILGDQLTAADLMPIFNGFLKDLDEVRNGVLKHLYDFLKVLHADKRKEYLHQLQEFMVTENSRNWRFRYELAEQLILIIELYSHYDVYDYFRQIALTLCSDNVSEVRRISHKLVVAILQKLHACGVHDLGLNFINELIVRFCHSPKWVGRQAFAFICQAIVEEDCMPMDQFVQHLLPSLLSLSSDPVANVRVLVAKALRQSIMVKAYFEQPGSAYSDELEETVMTLQADKDCDVRFFATLDPNKAQMETAPLTT